LLWLAATTWRKPLRFISTHSAAGYRPGAAGNGSGYVESKWRAEQIVAEARVHGIPAAVYRVPRLAGDSRTGRGNDRDIMFRAIRTILDLGAAPDIKVSEDWLPVDEAARLLVEPYPGPEDGGSFVLTSQHQISLSEVIELARRMGHKIEYRSTHEWRRDLVSRSVEEHEVLASALDTDTVNDALDEGLSAPQHGVSLDGFVPVIARGVTDEILHLYLRAMGPLHRVN
jgi:thioester reductase-like protein